MAGFFRRAKVNDIETINIGEGDDAGWIQVRKELSKREVNDIVRVAPGSTDDRDGIFNTMETFAEKLIVNWSMEDEDGNRVPFSIAEYRNLSHDTAQALDAVLNDQLALKVFGKKADELEKKPSQ